MSGSIGDRYREVVERVEGASARSGRRAENVRIVVAAKTFSSQDVAAAVSAGARDIGENYVQEALTKRRALSEAVPADLRWHLIGRLQRNKARQAVENFELVHSLDRVDLARDLDRAAARAGTTARCLIEVNLGGEATKGGVEPAEIAPLLDAIAPCSHLAIEGLMALPPPSQRPEASRRHFAFLRELAEKLGRLRLPNVLFKELSMGMSADFEVAVEEGATLVRVGTAIFGPRRAGK